MPAPITLERQTQSKPPTERKKKDTFLREIIKNRYLYLLTLPGILFLIVFNYLPMAGLYMSFVDYNPMAGLYGLKSEFVGLMNFKFFFTSNDWITVTINTIYLNILFIITGLAVQMFMAIGLNEIGSKTVKKIAQSFMFLPNFISWTVISIFSIALFSTDAGVINHVLGVFGLEPINYYQDASWWPFILVMLRLWKGVGFGTVIYLATISGLDQEMYEAARIDGANRFQSITRITLPMLKTTTLMLFILSIGGIFYGDFGMIYALVGDNPVLRPTTDVIDTYVYRALRMNNDIGMSSAVGLFQAVVGFILVLSANGITRKLSKDSALF
ncbi:sugar ABC transporter permease [Paenibacillus sp. CF384]|uniref:ABC transporter permease n=1 Tax=Paenibacillus sp. CF384 TaxID=1884382 RepID=UPI00089C66F8|nr:ABC transporter permease subunit [Paenibacillus sp. CF384]SDX05014.1 putative aldouronate transport system permease protein [Paenibacillus sp. CF384]